MKLKRLKADSGNICIVTPAKPVPYSVTGAGVYPLRQVDSRFRGNDRSVGKRK